ncbi:MAG: SoxR reducing system RseC family protein, partial [Treponema sp.]|nr:SoxR reducing system RseC family protein [Treponema sp.]
VAPEGSLACFGCRNRECKVNRGIFTVENPRSFDLWSGELVEIEHSGVSLLKDALVSLFPPLLGFMAGFWVPGLFRSPWGEAARAALGVLAMFAAAAAVYGLRRRGAPKSIPRIRRVFPEE